MKHPPPAQTLGPPTADTTVAMKAVAAKKAETIPRRRVVKNE